MFKHFYSQEFNLQNDDTFRYIMATLLLFILMKKVDLLPPSMKDLQIFRFLKNGMLVLKSIYSIQILIFYLNVKSRA